MSAPDLKFTLDRNILIAVEKREPDAGEIFKLIEAHNDGQISIAISAANRVENNKNRMDIQPLEYMIRTCNLIGLKTPEFLDYPLDWDMGLWEHGIISQEGYDLEMKIHSVLFPTIKTYRSDQQSSSERRKVTNAKCDVFAIWGHIYFGRNYFVTNDNRFHDKKPQLEALGAQGIIKPKEALKIIQTQPYLTFQPA